MLATWPNNPASTTIKVTTLASFDAASDLAEALTAMSEAAWYAAAWLDTWPAIGDYQMRLAEWLRRPSIDCGAPDLDLSAYRHDTADASNEYLGAQSYATELLSDLAHPQRLAIADEVEVDAIAAHETLAVFGRGGDVPTERGWQLLEVTRVEQFGGDLNYLPDGAAGWATRWFRAETIAERWAARGHLLRMEQLVAACLAVGGRAGAHQEPVQAHCVFPAEDAKDTVIVYAEPLSERYSGYRATPPMRVRIQEGGLPTRTREIDPYNTAEFADFLGDWVRAAQSRI